MPRVELVDVGAGRVVIVDTRRIAVKSLVDVSPEAVAAPIHFGRPRARDGDHRDHAAHVGELLARRFLVDHEDALMSVVVRAPQTDAKDITVSRDAIRWQLWPVPAQSHFAVQ